MDQMDTEVKMERKERVDFPEIKRERKERADFEGISLDDIIMERKKDQKDEDLSLDAIIMERKKDICKWSAPNGLNGSCSSSGSVPDRLARKRKLADDDDDPFWLAPLDAINEIITNEGLIIEHEIGKQTQMDQGRAHNWRAKYKCGDIVVACEASLKELARQAAAMELIKEMRKVEPGRKFPPCQIPEGCFYDPVVLRLLEDVVNSMGIEGVKYVTVQTRKHYRDYFTTTYYIGEDEFIGNSYNCDHSRLFAAKAAYETYSQKKYRRENIFVGDKCLRDKEYVCRETVAMHVVTVSSDLPIPHLVNSRLPQCERREAPSTSPSKLEEEELLVDDAGHYYIKAGDGSNKIRRLTKTSVVDLVDQAIQNLVDVGARAGDVTGAIAEDSVLADDVDEDELDEEEGLAY